MGNRTLVTYEEARLPEGPHWTLEIDRSANGAPGLIFTINTKTYREEDRHIESLNREMSVFVEDARDLLGPINEWLESNA